MNTRRRNHQAGFTLIEVIVSLVVAAIMASMIYTYFGTALTQSSVPITRLRQASNLHQVMENIVTDFNRLNLINLRYKWKSNVYYPLNSIVVKSIGGTIASNGFYYICTAAGTSGGAEPVWSTSIQPGLNSTNDGTVTWKTLQEEEVEVWQADHEYNSIGTVIIPTRNNGHYYKCTTTGTTAAIEPAPPTNPWTTTTNGTLIDGGVTWTEAGTILDSTDVTDNLKSHLTTNPGRYDNNSNSYTVVEAKFIQFNATTEVDAGTSGTSSEKNILKVTIQSNASGETLMQLFTIR